MEDMERRDCGHIGCGSIAVAMSVIVLILSCGITEMKKDTGSDAFGEDLELPQRTVCCVTAFDYPSECDWTDELSSGQKKCSLVVFADAVPCLRVPVGDGYEISEGYDLHRFLGGNLYTYYSKDGVTAVRKNGGPFLRYDADEILFDMILCGEDLFLLTQSHSGRGFIYRKNGNVLLEKFSGETFGRFWQDDNSLCFAYKQPVATPDYIDQRYYVVKDSRMIQVTFEKDINKVWDIMTHKGVPCSVVSSEYDGKIYLVKGDLYINIDLPRSAVLLSCRLFSTDDKVGAECTYEYPDGRCEGGIWIDGSEYIRFEAGRTISYICYNDDRVCCVLNPDESRGLIYDGERLFQMPEGYRCMGYQPAALYQDELYVALSSRDGGRPVVWHGGQMDTLRMNGYICSISFVESGNSYSSQ